MVECGGLENRCGLYGPSRVRIPTSPLFILYLTRIKLVFLSLCYNCTAKFWRGG